MPLSEFSPLELKPSNRVVALIDCNSFYCSCERIFRPDLKHKPVGVLSNNDGCIIALTPELKALGVTLGTPEHLHRHLFKKHQVTLFSSNYELYGDMSARIMSILSRFSPEVEVYSIDEAFIDLTHVAKNELVRMGHIIRNTILQWTGIPVGVGIASTKTLAKLANRQAKKHNGVASFLDMSDLDSLFKTLPVNEVWSINRKLMRRLETQKIHTIYDLKQVDNTFLMKHFSVLVMRTVFELRGISCIPISDLPSPKRGILNSRSFGQYVSDLETLSCAIAHHATHGAEELRAQRLCATAVMTYIRTNRNRSDYAQEHGSSVITFLTPTDYTPTIVQAAIQGLKECWKPGYFYQKAGVMLLELVPEGIRQRSFLDIHDDARADKLMTALDTVNKTFGRRTLKFGTEGFNKAWLMRRNHKSPSYTTDWHELLRI